MARITEELARFSKKQKSIIYDNLFAVELTDGCSIGCDFCGFESKKGVGGAIPFSVLKQIAEEMTQLTDRLKRTKNRFTLGNTTRLYDASDPLDYAFKGKDYFDAQALFESVGFGVFVSSAIPAGKEELAIKNIDKIDQVSISHVNRARLQPFFRRLGVEVFVDLSNYYQAKYGERYWEKVPIQGSLVPRVEETIERTVEGLRKIDPSLPEKTRFYDVRVDKNRLLHNVQDLSTLCLFCGNLGEYPREGKVCDRDEGGVRSWGRAYGYNDIVNVHGEEIDEPFGNTQGVKITPNGVFNVFCVTPEAGNKQGRIIEKVSPRDFRVVAYRTPQRAGISYLIDWECIKIEGGRVVYPRSY